MITTEQKNRLTAELKLYMQAHGMSQTEVAKHTGVNARYLINILKSEFTDNRNGQQVAISDKYFSRLANFIDFSLEKQYWEVRPTEQLKDITAALVDAKNNGETAVITGQTGCGKSFTCAMFQKKFPTEVFIVTVGSSDNLGDLLDKILESLKVDNNCRTKSSRIRKIAQTLKSMSEDGKEPVLIFDEAEYMKQPALCALKELYDSLNDYCALVMIGTQQLTDNIEKLRRRDKAGIPQLYRRIRYRIRPLSKIDKSFKDFLNGLDTELKTWLKQNCDNYGELHDVLVPAMREADRTGEKLSVDFVKMVLGI